MRRGKHCRIIYYPHLWSSLPKFCFSKFLSIAKEHECTLPIHVHFSRFSGSCGNLEQVLRASQFHPNFPSNYFSMLHLVYNNKPLYQSGQPGTCLTKDWWACCPNLMRLCSALGPTFLIPLSLNFAYATAALLSWHVQNCGSSGSLAFM